MNLRASAALALALAGATPLVGASAPLPAIRASGTLVTQITMSGVPLSLGGDVSVYHKGAMYRLDVRDLRVPGADAATTAMMQQLLPGGGLSILYDGATGASTAWSSASHTYYIVAPGSSGEPSAAPAPSGSAGNDPLAGLASVAEMMQSLASASVQLTGHRVINGHPTTDIDVMMKRQVSGKPPEDYHAQFALADDISDFPIQITVQSTGGTREGLAGTVKIDLTTVQRESPPDAVFVMPSGYARVNSLASLLGHAAP